MHRHGLTLAITAAVGLLASHPAFAQLLPSTERSAHIAITREPTLELAYGHLAIIRWATNNPGGSDVHFGVVHYGTDPGNLSRMAKSPIRLNRGHRETVFRVRLTGLTPRTTYYYRVTSIESGGNSDGVRSPVGQFTTPAPGERIVAYPSRTRSGG